MKVLGRKKGRQGMARQRHTAEEIINKLREAEVGVAEGMAVVLGLAGGVWYARRRLTN